MVDFVSGKHGVAPLGLYVHIPFCERKCPYCDFNTYAGLQNAFDATVDALCIEMEQWRDALAGRALTSIFVGGGTPTVLSASQLSRLFEAMSRCFTQAAGCEITCEANPGTVDRAKFQHLRSLGVNRLSLGVQSFQPDELEFLGRIHSVQDVEQAVDAARAAGFDNINLDFIFGLPKQRAEAWAATLARALALQPEHLSLYSLIVEPNTPLHHWVETGRVSAPDDDVAADLYEHALERLDAAGYVHYEVSNWARAGSVPSSHVVPSSTARAEVLAGSLVCEDLETEDKVAYACRHNLLYWRNQEYVGIGPGAHSHLRLDKPAGSAVSRRWSNRKPVPGYVKRVQGGQSIVQMEEALSAAVSQGETMMLGLRLVQEGVAFARFQAMHGCDLRHMYRAQLAQLAHEGLVEFSPTRVRTTSRGLRFANRVGEAFLAEETDESAVASHGATSEVQAFASDDL